MPAPSTPEEVAVVNAANEFLETYQGSSKFINDILAKRQRIHNFHLTMAQAEVVMKIADEEFERQQKEDEEPF